MKKNTLHSGFTLIEIIVSITIFSIIMVSVMAIFLFASQMSARVELNRAMQENIKNVLEDIAEWIRSDGIQWVATELDATCKWAPNMASAHKGTQLCLNSGESYVLWTQNQTTLIWERSSNIIADCGDIDDICHVLKRDSTWDYYPLTNSFLNFNQLDFYISNTKIPQISVTLVARPSYKKWLSTEIINNNTITVQTTLSQRLIETY